ncbi:MAG: 3-deoxy-8-phosphooctulonate synthase [Candidatus Omnitrophica bacterium]|nr:3-deoxy-8-phosphooctulonate synthase [Candidatus Omnitrophota bacterium]
MIKEVRIGSVKIGGDNPLVLIAGPCSIESQSSAMCHAKALKDITGRLGISFVYKASYDKANRTSIDSFRGPGLKKGLKILKDIKEKLGVPVPRQTDLILAAAKTGKAVNIKKGQFLAPWDMRHIVKKIESTGNKNIVLTERGVSFGYNNLVSDFRSVLIMKDLGYPVVYDATHSVQMPGGMGDRSGGERRFIPYLSMAAVACGVNGIFVEVHENPDKALSDGPNMVKLDQLEAMLMKLKRIERVVK